MRTRDRKKELGVWGESSCSVPGQGSFRSRHLPIGPIGVGHRRVFVEAPDDSRPDPGMDSSALSGCLDVNNGSSPLDIPVERKVYFAPNV